MPISRYQENLASILIDNAYGYDPNQVQRVSQTNRTVLQQTYSDSGLSTQMRTLGRIISFASKGVKMFEKAEADLTTIADKLYGMKKLADKSASIATTASERDSFQQEFSNERQSIDNLARSSAFDGVKLLDGSFDYRFQTGQDASEVNRIRVQISSLRLNKINSYEQGASNARYLDQADLTEVGKTNISEPTSDPVYKTDAQIAVDNAIDKVNKELRSVAALKNQFDSIVRTSGRTAFQVDDQISGNDAEKIKNAMADLEQQKAIRTLDEVVSTTRKQLSPNQSSSVMSIGELVPSLTRMTIETTADRNKPDKNFFVENADLLKLIDSNKKLLNDYFLKDDKTMNKITSRKDIERRIVDYVSEQFSASTVLDRKYFETNSQMTKFLALNPGNIVDIVKADKSLQKLLESSAYIETNEADLLAAKASDLFSDFSVLTKDFFKENLSLALFFLDNTDIAHQIRNNTLAPVDYNGAGTGSGYPASNTELIGEVVIAADLSEEKVKDLMTDQAVIDKVDRFLAGKAEDILGHRFNFTTEEYDKTEDFQSTSVPDRKKLPNDRSLVQYIVGEEILNGPQLQTFAYRRNDLLTDTGDKGLAKFIDAYEISKAFEKTGVDFPLGYSFYNNNVGIARLVAQSDKIVEAMKDDRRKLASIYDLKSGDRYSYDHIDKLRSGLKIDQTAVNFQTPTLSQRYIDGNVGKLVGQLNKNILPNNRQDGIKIDGLY